MSSPGRRAATLLAGACVVASVLLGCGSEEVLRRDSEPRSASTSTPPTTAPVSTAEAGGGFPEGWEPAAPRWGRCRGRSPDLECADLEVPLDWSRPDGPTVRLALARRPAGGARIGLLVTNPGGPGASGVDFLDADPFSGAVGEAFDVVSWDPRGVGSSTSLSCGAGVADFLALDADPDDPDEQAQLDRAAAAVAAECARTDGDLLAHLATADAALDLEAIRRALGDEPLTYVGFSYGTQIGQAYAERFPTRIRAMVLDGVVDPALGFTEFLLQQARGFEAAFDDATAACARAGPRRCGVTDLARSFDRVKARAEVSPIPAGRDRVGPSEVVVAATYVLYLEDGWAELGPALARAEDGDARALLDLARRYYDFGGYPAYAAVVCTDAPPPAGPDAYRAFADEARRVAPRFGGAVANELLPCATWPAPADAGPAPVTAAGAPPILVVGTTGDPATPYAGAVAVAERLASGVLLTVEGAGHTAYGSNRCATGAVDRYLIDLRVPPAGTICR
jgi:pimeloyl-ACP methyl ester carboxylesterase